MDSINWRARLSEPIKQANELAECVLTAYVESEIAAEYYQASQGKEDEMLKQESLGRYGDRFIQWMYELEDRTTDLNQSLFAIGNEFAVAAVDVPKLGPFSASSVHQLVHSVADDIATRVSVAMTKHLVDGWSVPGVEMVIPRLFVKDDFQRALPVAIQAFLDRRAELETDINLLYAMLEQELAAIVRTSTPLTQPEGRTVVSVNTSTNIVSIAGKSETWPVDPRVANILNELVEAKRDGSQYVKGPILLTLPGCTGMNVSRTIRDLKKAVPPLEELIKSNTQLGYWLNG